VSAKAGIDVVLLDTTQEAADKGKAYSQGLLDKAVKKGRSTAEKRDALLARITPPPTTRSCRAATSSSRRCSRTAPSRPT
jgi:3-hydroxyacyl-CoA dehydrogenase